MPMCSTRSITAGTESESTHEVQSGRDRFFLCQIERVTCSKDFKTLSKDFKARGPVAERL